MNATKIKKNVLIILNAKVNGTDIEIRMIMDIAKLVLKNNILKE